MYNIITMYNKTHLDLDLNIDNYSLEDILHLFHIQVDFNESDLKNIKRKVLMTHPDKSNLDKKYFLFYSKAYKLLYNLYKLKNIKHTTTNYKTLQNEIDIFNNEREKNIYSDFISKFSKSRDFNKVFHELFEKNKIKYEDDEGYEEWFRSNDDIYGNDKIVAEKRKQEIRNNQIIKCDTTEIYNNHIQSSNLVRNRPEYYESDIFSSLKYEDLKKAHTETMIGITEEDYLNKEKFNSIDELQRHRKKVLNDINIENHQETYKQQKLQEINNDTQRLFQLMKQDEKIKNNNNNIMSFFQRLVG